MLKNDNDNPNLMMTKFFEIDTEALLEIKFLEIDEAVYLLKFERFRGRFFQYINIRV